MCIRGSENFDKEEVSVTGNMKFFFVIRSFKSDVVTAMEALKSHFKNRKLS